MTITAKRRFFYSAAAIGMAVLLGCFVLEMISAGGERIYSLNTEKQ